MSYKGTLIYLCYNDPMIDKYWYEFSKIYARLMRLELKIKKDAVTSATAYYDAAVLQAFSRFFKNKRRRDRYSCNGVCKFDKILNDKRLSDEIKFEKLVNLLYFSDILNLILKTKEFKDQNVAKNFYYKIPTRYKDLEDCIKKLIDLRNCIAHYNFKLYRSNKKSFLDSLLLFETHLGHNILGVMKLPRLKKPNIKNILNEIYNIRPDLIMDLKSADDCKNVLNCNGHRLLMTLYDDIAIYNGVAPNNLPSPSSVLTELYKLRQNAAVSIK